jgi:hypothetical protein
MEFRRRTRLPQDAKKALSMLDIKFKESSGGFCGFIKRLQRPDFPRETKIAVEDLSVENIGLTRLPDFSKVEVRGIFNCAQNKLTSLEGAPEAPMDEFICSQNLLRDFTTCPTSFVRRQFRYNSNAMLMSIAGIPKAPSYVYGNTKWKEPHTAAQPVSPMDRPELFPGFKSK